MGFMEYTIIRSLDLLIMMKLSCKYNFSASFTANKVDTHYVNGYTVIAIGYSYRKNSVLRHSVIIQLD